MNESLAPQIDQLIKELQSLQTQTSRLQTVIKEIEQDQSQLTRSEENRTRITGEIKRLTFDYQRALERTDNNLATNLGDRLRKLEKDDLANADKIISNKQVEISQLKKEKEQLQSQRLHQLINTFQALNAAVVYVKTQGNYFDRYIWLIYLRDNIGVQKLNAKELPSLADQMAANGIFDNFEKELAASEQLLTEQDKKDIDSAIRLNTQIPKDEQKIHEMKRFLGKESNQVASLRQRLDKITAMQGYPPQKLSGFLIAGLILIAIGILFVYLGVPSAQNNSQPVTSFLISGLALILTGGLLLWLRHSNNKEKRLPEITRKLEVATGQHSRNTTELQSLEQQTGKNKNEFSAILKRRPILEMIVGAKS
jgi:hypothetical protein